MIYIFDVDGTLTPSRGEMDPEFANFFEHFATHHACYLVTGSDRQKTLEQIPESIYNLFIRAYQCSGNHVFEQGKEVYRDDWKITDKQNIFLLDKLDMSPYQFKTGFHFDHRPGLCNFSIVGRNAGPMQRADYVQFDEMLQERKAIAEAFNAKFKDMNATVAGETGIDITPKGKGKSQILRDFKDHTQITFFGDKTMPGGNDYDLANAIDGGTVWQVQEWTDTLQLLKLEV